MPEDEFHWLYEKDLKYLTRKALEEECNKRGIKTDAKRKATLVNRILQWQEDQAPDSDAEDIDNYELDEDAEREARDSTRNGRTRRNGAAGDDGDSSDDEDATANGGGNDADAFMKSKDEAYDEGDEAANEAYAKKHGHKAGGASSKLFAVGLAMALAAAGYAAFAYLTYEDEAHAQQMY